MPSPVFVVTDAGLANTFPDPNYPNRVVIYITDFEVGSAFGQPATRYDTGLFGNRLFGPTAPTTYANIPAGGVDIVLTIPPDAGPFEYGEVAIYNQGPQGRTLFAHAVFDTPQMKYSSLETNVGSAEVFHALLRLEQATAVFKINSLIDPTLETVDLWSDVNPPGLGMDPGLPLVRVLEPSPTGDASLLINANPQHWTVGTTYDYLAASTVANASTTSVDVPAASLSAENLSNINRKYVVEFLATGLFRSATNLVNLGANYRFNLNPAALPDIPAIGSQVKIYEAAALKQVPLATTTVPGRVRPGNGIALPQPGLIETYGLLHGVPGAGRQLNINDNLNPDPRAVGALQSGIYSISQFSMPQGMVPQVDWPGHIVIQNFGDYYPGSNNAQQIYYPAGSGQTGDAQGVNGLPPYWRSWNPNAGVWTNWFPFVVTNKKDINNPSTGVLEGPFTYGANVVASGIFQSDGETIMGWNSGSDPLIRGYINGSQVVAGDSNAGPEGVTIVGYTGASWSMVAQRHQLTLYRMRY